MLVQLDIENIAVIEKANIEFEPGLNVITGETGAGKSLMINSLGMILGHRTGKEIIREGAPFARVSATFFAPDLKDYLADNGIDDDTFIKIKKDKDTKIALSIEGKIIALSSDNDSIININPQESGSKIKVVATKQDYYRHEGFIDVKSILDNDDLFIYPNPTKDFLFVESKGINKIEIYNSVGQKLMGINNSSSREKVVIDCSTLKKGLFLLHIIYEDKRVGKSFIRL